MPLPRVLLRSFFAPRPFVCSSFAVLAFAFPSGQDWTNYVRIGAYGLKGARNAAKIVQQRPGKRRLRHRSRQRHPRPLRELCQSRRKTEGDPARSPKRRTRAGNHAFVYIAGTECITANADQTPAHAGQRTS